MSPSPAGWNNTSVHTAPKLVTVKVSARNGRDRRSALYALEWVRTAATTPEATTARRLQRDRDAGLQNQLWLDNPC